MKFATKTIHAGQPSEPETGSLIAPIFQTSTYEQDAPGQDKGFNYSRTNNPTRQRLETVLAELEGVEYAAVFASGLAAENAVLQAYLRPGDEIVIPHDVYGGTYRILNKVFHPIGVVIKQFDIADLVALEAAITNAPSFCGSNPRRIRGCSFMTFPKSAVWRTRNQRWLWWTTPSPLLTFSNPSNWAQTSSSTA